MKIPDYVLTESFTYYMGSSHDSRTLEPGSFVKPIDARWLPAHITKSDSFRWTNHKTEVYCYTHYGIILIPRKLLRQV